MSKINLIVFFIIALACTAFAQQDTEIYIPIGKSPGLSDKMTTIGTVSAFNESAMMVTVQDSTGSQAVRITPETKIWVDKSLLKQRNEKGSPSDFKNDARVEIKYVENDKSKSAEWVKIQLQQ